MCRTTQLMVLFFFSVRSLLYILSDVYLCYFIFCQMEFTDALSELYREDMFPLRNVDIKDELRSTRGRFRSMKENVGSSSQFRYIRMITTHQSIHF